MKQITKAIALLTSFLHLSLINAQVSSTSELDSKYLNWYNKDYETTNITGASINKAYKFIDSKDRTGKTVIVAVIDSGVDIEHEDLKGKIWLNEDEVPANGIDDDNNGYVDDMHGWNFLGNAKGENIKYENLEYTIFVKENDSKNPHLQAAKNRLSKELANRKQDRANIDKFQKMYIKAKSVIQEKLGIHISSAADLKQVDSTDEKVLASKNFLAERYGMGFTEEGLKNMISRSDEYLKYMLNVDFNPREIIGDDPKNIRDKNYGNPDVIGPRSNHGTSSAGVIAAIRDNDIGIDGIATNVKIMCIRAIPKGDERDKDVALSIYYAVDNGADIINMSFGKDFSPEKKWVDDAVKYASQKGVLIVHASGNSGDNIDASERYPSGRYLDQSEASNWLNVGATAMQLDKEVAAIFSNYGKKHVDLFAPGVNIISTDSTNNYGKHSGTSLAAPVVTGVAALVLSYYPNLQPVDLVDILKTSAFQFKKPRKVLIPTLTNKKRKKIKFSQLSVSGGIVNAYNALLEAERRITSK